MLPTSAAPPKQYFKGEQIGERGEKVDVFSFGVILWEMVTRVMPWRNIIARDPKCVVWALLLKPVLPVHCCIAVMLHRLFDEFVVLTRALITQMS